MARRNLTSSTPCLRIICCINGGIEICNVHDDDGCTGDGDDAGIIGDDDYIWGTASVTEVLETCWGNASNSSMAFTISPGVNFGIAAANLLYSSDSCSW